VIQRLESVLGAALGRWLEGVARHARAIVVGAVVVSAACLHYTAANLGIDSDDAAMLSEDLPFRALRTEFHRQFPPLADPILLVVDGDTPGRAQDAAEALARRLRGEPDITSVFVPGGGPFFEKHGLLYLPPEELDQLSDHLTQVQPYLAELTRDGSLRGYVGILGDAVEHAAAGGDDDEELAEVLDHLSAAFEAATRGDEHRLSWTDLILGDESTPDDRRRFVMVEPRVDYAAYQPAGAAIETIRDTIAELGLDGSDGVRVRMTGYLVLAYEEMELVAGQARLAGIASFLLVSVILFLAMRSARLVLSAVATLLVGLVLTAGFATAAIGYLNLISVAFAVLFIGLSVDFGIHFCIRYREVLGEGLAHTPALRDTGYVVGSSLVLCAATTAIGFYAFIPTDYKGVAELGLISGTGMIISLFCNLTLLPALLSLSTSPESAAPAPEDGPGAARPAPAWLDAAARIRTIPVRHPRVVWAFALLAAVGAAAVLPEVRFDRDPVKLRDPSAESVQVFRELLAEGSVSPWSVHVLVDDLAEAEALAGRLEDLETVDRALTLRDFVPGDQEEKLEILRDISFFLQPVAESIEKIPPPTVEEQMEALAAFADRLGRLERSGGNESLRSAAARLRIAVLRFHERARQAGSPEAALASLESSVLGTLPGRLRALFEALRADRVTLADLPDDLVDRMVARDGRVRIEVFPKEDLSDGDALEAFVTDVQTIAPEAIGNVVVMLESERAVVRSLRQALITAVAIITVLLLFLWRTLVDTLIVMIPLGLAAILTGAASAVLDIPFNFADVIVIPLLLGMGVDSGIHLVHRSRTAAPTHGNLLRTTTARAVTFSALTTMASFGTLGFSSHPGMASLGQLLTIGIAFVLLCNLIVLPALVAGYRGR
jgi:hopanoid biosynthesis associated RND transporter like protein HpnN